MKHKKLVIVSIFIIFVSAVSMCVYANSKRIMNEEVEFLENLGLNFETTLKNIEKTKKILENERELVLK